MDSTNYNRTVIDIGDTVTNNLDIVPYLVAAHALSGCDTAAPYHGIGKLTVVKKLREGALLDAIGGISINLATAIEQATAPITKWYGYKATDMTDCRIQSWFNKTSKVRKTAPALKTLPPTKEAFSENVKRGLLQAIWYYAMECCPPEVDVTLYGWHKDLINGTLVPVGIPDGVSPAPDAVLDMVQCGCSSNSPCSSKRCSCSSSRIVCSIMCKYRGDPDV